MHICRGVVGPDATSVVAATYTAGLLFGDL